MKIHKDLLQKIEKILTHEVLSANDRALYDILILAHYSVGLCEETVLWLADILRMDPVVLWGYISKNSLLELVDGQSRVRLCVGLSCSRCSEGKKRSWMTKPKGCVIRTFSCLGLCFDAPVMLESGCRPSKR